MPARLRALNGYKIVLTRLPISRGSIHVVPDASKVVVDAHVGDTAVSIAVAGAAARVVHTPERGREETQMRLRRAKIYRHLANATTARQPAPI